MPRCKQNLPRRKHERVDTKDRDRRVFEAWQTGARLADIAGRFGLSRKQISEICTAQGADVANTRNRWS